MEFPIEEVITAIVKPAAKTIGRLIGDLRKPDDDEADENGDRKDNVKKAVLILTQETQAKKSCHVEQFVKNTIYNPECELEDSTIFSFLKDVEQMTWRQFCLLEGFRRKERTGRDKIEISRYGRSDVDGISIETEIKKLIDLNYLNRHSDSLRNYMSTEFDDIYLSPLGQEISKLLDLQSVEIDEIAKAFGGGRVKWQEVR